METLTGQESKRGCMAPAERKRNNHACACACTYYRENVAMNQKEEKKTCKKAEAFYVMYHVHQEKNTSEEIWADILSSHKHRLQWHESLKRGSRNSWECEEGQTGRAPVPAHKQHSLDTGTDGTNASSVSAWRRHVVQLPIRCNERRRESHIRHRQRLKSENVALITAGQASRANVSRRPVAHRWAKHRGERCR